MNCESQASGTEDYLDTLQFAAGHVDIRRHEPVTDRGRLQDVVSGLNVRKFEFAGGIGDGRIRMIAELHGNVRQRLAASSVSHLAPNSGRRLPAQRQRESQRQNEILEKLGQARNVLK